MMVEDVKVAMLSVLLTDERKYEEEEGEQRASMQCRR
jgi:hypothetical protein